MVETDSAVKKKVAQGEVIRLVVPNTREGQRLDHYLVEMVANVSRSRLSNLIRDGFVFLNGSSSKSGNRLKSGDIIELTLPPPEPVTIKPEKVDFTVLHEDDDLLIIAKPPGVVVHPSFGHKKGTLVHGLLAHCDNLSGISGIERPGIASC